MDRSYQRLRALAVALAWEIDTTHDGAVEAITRYKLEAVFAALGGCASAAIPPLPALEVGMPAAAALLPSIDFLEPLPIQGAAA